MIKKNTGFWKKFVAILTLGIVFGGSVAGITFSTKNIIESTKLSSDFDNGVSYSLKFNLVDDENKPLYTTPNANSYLLNDPSKVMSEMNKIGNIVANQLNNLGLTNISVSSGVGSYSYSSASSTSTGTQVIPVGYVNMTFENSQAVFGLSEEDDMDFLNDSKIVSKIGESNRYVIENVAQRYPKYTSATSASDPNTPSTMRTNSYILADKDGVHLNSADGTKDKDRFYVSSPSNISEKIKDYVDSDDVVDSNALQLVQNNFYYLKPFIQDKYDYDKIVADQSASNSEETPATYSSSAVLAADDTTVPPSTDDTTPPAEEDKPDAAKQFQAHQTWLLWKNKQGLINYLNRLVYSAYCNVYANNINIRLGGKYEVGTPKLDSNTNTNAIDTNLRKQINAYLDNLSPLEKEIIQFITSSAGNISSGNFKSITEENLMGFLWEFYNSTYCSENTVGIYQSTDKPINRNNHSDSQVNGWSFIDAANADLSSLLSPYLIQIYDYTSFNNAFLNPKTSKEQDEEIKDEANKDKPIFYTTNKIKLLSNTLSTKTFKNELENQQYVFPLLDIPNQINLNNMSTAITAAANLNTRIQAGEFGSVANEIFKDNPDYKKDVEEIANNFRASIVFGNIAKSRQRYAAPAFYDWPIFNILLIVLSAIILLVGIIVSIIYRVPGIFSFLFAGLTFTGSLAFFNIFGFTFSFFSFMGLIIGTFLSFLIPFYIFKNFRKEINEGSSIYGAYIKTIKKYWKLALDTHIVPLLIAFSFLFFGKNNLVDFGALLTISTFLSLILSCVLLFVSIIIMITMFDAPSPKAFMTYKQARRMKEVNDYIALHETNKGLSFELGWYEKRINKFDFYKKWRLFASLGFVFVSIIGVILLFVLGPGFSVDFSNGHILIIHNADLLEKVSPDFIANIPNQMGEHYMFDNVWYIQLKSASPEEIFKLFNALPSTDPVAKETLLNSYSIAETSTYISDELVHDAFVCFGISLSFVAVWSLISINWVSILPIAIVQCVVILLSLGWVGITRMPFNIEGIAIAALIFVIASIYMIALLSSVKISWDRKKTLSYLELNKLVNSILSKINSNLLHFLGLFILFAALSAIFTANFLLAMAFINMIVNVLIVALVVPYLLLPLWNFFISLKNIYVKELVQSSKNKKMQKAINYDAVDEQLVKGLNC